MVFGTGSFHPSESQIDVCVCVCVCVWEGEGGDSPVMQLCTH